MNTSKSWYYYSLFGLLYFVQGAALAYFRNFQKPYLNNLGIDAGRIGILTSILLFPFIIKIFIGIFSDKYSLFGLGHRKPYILAGLLLGVLAFASVSGVLPDSNFYLFSILIILASFSVALFDSSTDGFAIDVTPPKQYGRVQGIMIGGRAVGFIILSLLFGFLVQKNDYSIIFITVSILMLLPFIYTLFASEKQAVNKEQKFEWTAFASLLKPQFLIFAVYAIFYSIISFGVDGLVTFYMSYSYQAVEKMIGQYGALRGTGAVIGAVVGGVLMDKIGHKKIAFTTVFIISLGAAMVGFSTSISMLLKVAIFWGIAWGFQETVFVALAMSLADARIAASMFAIMMALSNVGTAITEGVATAISVDIGFHTVFFILALFNFFNLVILYFYFKIKARS